MAMLFLNWLQAVISGGISTTRLLVGIKRRILDLPNHLAWIVQMGPGSFNYDRLSELKDKYSGDRCIIIGNGPSLSSMDLSPLKGESAFGLNRLYLKFDEMSFRPTFYVSIDELVLEQFANEISGVTSLKFLNWSCRALFEPPDETIFVRVGFLPRFSKDIRTGIWGGSTVTFAALQIAYFLGFSTVILIGVDHSYSVQGSPHQVVVSNGRDLDHFDPDYFRPGIRRQLPDLKTAEFAYGLARRVYEEASREIINATTGGQLEIFRRADYKSLFGTRR